MREAAGDRNEFSLVARTDTFIKASDLHSRDLPANEKLRAASGTVVRARQLVRQGKHFVLSGAAIGDSPLGEMLRYTAISDWYVSDERDKSRALEAAVPPSRSYRPVALDWVPTVRKLSENFIHFRPGNGLLVVTFDHLGAHHSAAKPWAEKFVTTSGYSLLGITSTTPSWFRASDLHFELEQMAGRGFFHAFERVVFAGPSMGGFGAGVFSSLHPGSTVIMTSPQSTMDLTLIPWEKRYRIARRLTWGGPFNDVAQEIGSAATVYAVVDPYFEPDRRHVQRLPDHNKVLLPAYHLGHTLVSALQDMGVLKYVMRHCIEGTMTPDLFRQIMPLRRRAQTYYRHLYAHAEARGKSAVLEALRRRRPDIDFSAPIPER